MNLKINDYVRTKQGFIAKLTDFNEYIKFYKFDSAIWRKGHMQMDFIDSKLLDNYYAESSPNILDLIQEGDYINEYRVANRNGNFYLLDNFNTCVEDIEIKNIVTKERFKEIQYDIQNKDKN